MERCLNRVSGQHNPSVNDLVEDPVTPSLFVKEKKILYTDLVKLKPSADPAFFAISARREARLFKLSVAPSPPFKLPRCAIPCRARAGETSDGVSGGETGASPPLKRIVTGTACSPEAGARNTAACSAAMSSATPVAPIPLA
eukprot:CAMPEP_0177708664 /NCGR_PEP_ID=MMETSP0484_2-20121128/10397_1 /TAXON_ID=354590 /ORGANISM="Rhodomonas lens, Strain RHODO" /LENGTH=141 /DNA_ID=CAMNT_0019220243 /DNA_START=663 /DNA_END=1085 /DNA_ORIENTATION=-